MGFGKYSNTGAFMSSLGVAFIVCHGCAEAHYARAVYVELFRT